MLHSAVKKGKSVLGGYGLFANHAIKKGEVIWRLDKNHKKYTEAELVFLAFEQQERVFQYYEDFILTFDDSEYMNHSCDPNVWYEGDEVNVARRDIQAGDEITYDYITTETDWTAPWECKCNAKNCRKIISSVASLTSDFQKKYKNHLPSWVIRYINKNKTA